MEDAGVFGKEAKDQAGHEVIHVVPALHRAPVGVFPKEFHVKAVQAAGGADVEGVFPDLFDRGNPGERQEEAEMIGEGRVVVGDRFAVVGKTLGLQRLTIGGKDEFCLLLGRGRAVPQGGKRGGDFAIRADLEVDVVPLEDAAGEVGLVGAGFPLGPETLDGGLLISESFEEGVGKNLRIEGLLREP